MSQVPQVLEICLVPITNVASQYPGVYIFSSVARMVRPVLNLSAGQVEMIGTFEQVGTFPDATLPDVFLLANSSSKLKLMRFLGGGGVRGKLVGVPSRIVLITVLFRARLEFKRFKRARKISFYRKVLFKFNVEGQTSTDFYFGS